MHDRRPMPPPRSIPLMLWSTGNMNILVGARGGCDEVVHPALDDTFGHNVTKNLPPSASFLGEALVAAGFCALVLLCLMLMFRVLFRGRKVNLIGALNGPAACTSNHTSFTFHFRHCQLEKCNLSRSDQINHVRFLGWKESLRHARVIVHHQRYDRTMPWRMVRLSGGVGAIHDPFIAPT